jgi:predicted dehydrogenase
MNRSVKAGLVGIGKMGILHSGILHSMDVVKLQAVTEKDKRTHNFIKTVLPDIRVYSDYEEMLNEEDLDLVYITTPIQSHVEMAEACVEKSINFFVEKPLGTSTNECLNLVRKIRQNPVTNMVGYCYHFVDTFEKAKAIIDSDALGNLVHLNSYMYVSQALFKKSKGRTVKYMPGSGVLNVLATHLLDVLLWLFNDIYKVKGSIRPYYSGNIEDFAHAYLVFRSGLEGYMDASWSMWNYRLAEIKIEVEGEKGKLILTNDYVKLYLAETLQWKTYYKQDLYNGVDIDVGGPEYTREDVHFVQSVLENRDTMTDVYYAMKVQTVTDAIYESALQERPVTIDFNRGVE